MADVYSGRFEGRRAVVTGGASGIGEAVVKRILTEGGQVTVWDLKPSAVAGVTSREVDISDPVAVGDAMTAAVADMGGLDILVASAGITGPNVTTWAYPIDDWQRVIDLNLNGVFYCNRAAAREMKEAGYGRIVNVASIAGKEGNPNASAYSTSKAGVIGLTKSLGKELAMTGVTVNAVTPAAVRTAIFDQMTPEFIHYMESKIPMGRFGTVDEIAAMICWLASDEASFCTGAVFDQSGGRATY